MNIRVFFMIAALSMTTAAAEAKLRVACTLPTIEALVREVAGDGVEAFSLAAGDQDPHFVSPTPVLMRRVREADLFFELGMQLETWADEVANGSGNPKIFRGARGRIAVSQGIPKLEVPSSVTRAQGDTHPEGNPHVWLDPARAKMVAGNIARALKAASPELGPEVDRRLADFEKRVDEALFGKPLLEAVGGAKLTRLLLDGRLYAFLDSNEYDGKKLSALAGGWIAKAAPLRGRKTIEFHKVWVYFARAFGFELIGTIEERPGIQPGPRHLRATIDTAKAQGVRLILVDNFYDPAVPVKVGEESGAKVVLLPNQVRGEKGVDTYFALIDHVLGKMLAAL
jgi:zinc/manganese transport system substrate-binding protein